MVFFPLIYFSFLDVLMSLYFLTNLLVHLNAIFLVVHAFMFLIIIVLSIDIHNTIGEAIE